MRRQPGNSERYTRALGWLSSNARALKSRRNNKRRLLLNVAPIMSVATVGVYATVRSRRSGGSRRPVRATAVVTVKRPVEEVFSAWQDFEAFPDFMHHLESVTNVGGGRSHWKAKAPAGMSVEWDAEVVKALPNQSISWRSVEGADVDNSGTVTFKPAPGSRGTEVYVELNYVPPAGQAGKLIASLLGEEPQQQIRDDMRRFKQIIETGQITRSDGTPGGISTRNQLLQKDARPSGNKTKTAGKTKRKSKSRSSDEMRAKQ